MKLDLTASTSWKRNSSCIIKPTTHTTEELEEKIYIVRPTHLSYYLMLVESEVERREDFQISHSLRVKISLVLISPQTAKICHRIRMESQ